MKANTLEISVLDHGSLSKREECEKWTPFTYLDHARDRHV